MQKQILEGLDKHLPPHLCGYRKGYSTQTALRSMLEKWKLSIDKKGFACRVIAKLHAYQCCTQSGFGQTDTYISTVHLSGTHGSTVSMAPRFQDPARKTFKIQSIQICLKCTLRFGLRSFYKHCAKTPELKIWAPILI